MTSTASHHYDYAGYWIRLAAFCLDVIIYYVLLLLISHLFAFTESSGFAASDALVSWVFLSYFFLLPFFSTVFFWTVLGATPGKWILRLQVVDENTGQRLPIAQATIRYLGYYISIIPFGIGFLWIAAHKNKQGWHDSLAKSAVVHRSSLKAS